MFNKEFWKWFIELWNGNFQDTFSLWGLKADQANALNWHHIELWIIFFIIFSILMVRLLGKSKLIEKLSKHILPLSLFVWIGGVVVYIIGFYNSGVNGLSVVLRAILSSFKMFVVSHDLARIPGFLQNDASYMAAFAVLHFCAAFIMFLFVFKMIGYKLLSSIRVIFHRFCKSRDKVVHLFWGVNEASVLLAEDINREHPTETIIFVDIDIESDDCAQKKPTLSKITNSITIKNSEIDRLEEIDAFVDHCYNGPAAIKGDNAIDVFGKLNLRNSGAIVAKSNKSNFYFLSDDESQNIAGALNLQKDGRLKCLSDNGSTIYIHARRDANNEIFDHYSQYDEKSKRVKIKIIDSAYLSVLTLKQEDNALPVYCVKHDPSTGFVDSSFNALIIGFGETGQEAFKFLYEFSAFVGSDMRKSPFMCYAIDEQMNKFAGLIRENMPDIGEDELALIHASVNSKEFWCKIREIITDLNYVVIALDNDALGLSLAVNMFKYALRHRSTTQPMLKIMLRCYYNANEKRMSEVARNLNHSIEGSNIEIILFGQEEMIYSCRTILSDDILKEAMEFNRVYENSSLSAEEQWEKNFGDTEINRLMNDKKMSRYHAIYDINRCISQNVSNSLHSSTKMALMGFDTKESSERLRLYYGYVKSREPGSVKYVCNKDDEQLLINMAILEHERWVASHKLMGYTYDPVNDCVKKRHKCICGWDDLDEMTQSYDCNVVDTTIKMAYNKTKE
jgi:hypothetical protein